MNAEGKTKMRLATKAIHVGQEPDPTTGATVPPIHVTSTYTQEAPGEHKGYEYSRTDTPTRRSLEACLASLEGGAGAVCYSSGLAATSGLIGGFLRPGDSIVAFSDLYGGSYRLFEQIYGPWGLVPRYTDDPSPAALADLIDETTRLVWIETPTNPLLRLLDIRAVAEAVQTRASNQNILLAVDNTFATPVLQRPLELGADLVVHSMTKYIGGHSDLVAGTVIAARDDLLEPLRFQQNAVGAVPGAFTCYLAQRGLKTLEVRLQRHCANARRIAEWAKQRTVFSRVIYPGLPDHPDHDLASRQMDDFGGMVTCVLSGGLDAARHMMTSTKLFSCAESLGGVESLITHPAIMTHASIPREIRERTGVVDGLVRLSVGIEDPQDLIEDLQQALP